MVQIRAKILVHRRIASDHFLMRLKVPVIARRAQPGQFVHIRCIPQDVKGDSPFPLLRRPFSLLDADTRAGTIDFIYKVVGLGTERLTRIPKGSRLDLLGPLGHPFEIPKSLQTAYLIGGGVGIPPLYFLAKWLVKRRQASDVRRQAKAFLGARTKEWVICAADFRKLGVPVYVATDDGTLGDRGSVVDLLRSHLDTLAPNVRRGQTPDTTLYICGPTPMMAAAAKVARRRGLTAQVSLEERMGCALGCCMGCTVEMATEPVTSHKRFQRVCTEGPVFPAEVIRWR